MFLYHSPGREYTARHSYRASSGKEKVSAMSELDIQIREAECPACEAERLQFTEVVTPGLYDHEPPCEHAEENHAR